MPAWVSVAVRLTGPLALTSTRKGVMLPASCNAPVTLPVFCAGVTVKFTVVVCPAVTAICWVGSVTDTPLTVTEPDTEFEPGFAGNRNAPDGATSVDCA